MPPKEEPQAKAGDKSVKVKEEEAEDQVQEKFSPEEEAVSCTPPTVAS